MARLVYGLNQTLDGFVDHTAAEPDPVLFRHFIEQCETQAGCLYGRVMYETMRVWDDEGWAGEEQAYARAWRNLPKWVVSRSLKEVGPNATLISDDLEGAVRRIKAEVDGEIEVAGPVLANSLTQLGLVDEYRIYLHPVAAGDGKPYFAGPAPRLRLRASEQIGDNVVMLSYLPQSSGS